MCPSAPLTCALAAESVPRTTVVLAAAFSSSLPPSRTQVAPQPAVSHTSIEIGIGVRNKGKSSVARCLVFKGTSGTLGCRKHHTMWGNGRV
jgi:hypothetical protein